MERLKRRTDFRATATGVRAPGTAFVLQARRRDETGAPRVGFTVSKQVGNAVERNRVRRRLREIVRLAPETALRDGHDYVLVGRQSALKTPFAKMLREFDAALNRVHTPGATGAGRGRSPHGAGRDRDRTPPGNRSPEPSKER